MELNSIFALTPVMSAVIFWSCVLAAVSGGGTLYLLARQPRVQMDLSTLINRKEIMLLGAVLMLERLASAFTFIPPEIVSWHLMPNLGMKVSLAIVLTASFFTMLHRQRDRRGIV